MNAAGRCGGNLEGIRAAGGALHIGQVLVVNPRAPVACAAVTHASRISDALGSERLIVPEPLAYALPAQRAALPVPLGEPFAIGEATARFVSTGMAGGAQLCIEAEAGRMTVLTGALAADVAPAECELLVLDATYALPIFRWPSSEELVDALRIFVERNAEAGRAAVIAAEPSDEARALLQLASRPALVHAEVAPFAPEAPRLDEARKNDLAGKLVVVPPTALADGTLSRIGPHDTARASGRMRVRGNRRRLAVDRGFVLSSRADWPTLLRAAEQSGARRIQTFGSHAATLARVLVERGFDARALEETPA